jgi:hypothetical protein
MKRTKGAVVALLAFVVMGLSSGCLGNGWWSKALVDTALYVGQKFLLDNNGVFNIFSTNDTT